MTLTPSSLALASRPSFSCFLYSRLNCTWSLARGTPLSCIRSITLGEKLLQMEEEQCWGEEEQESRHTAGWSLARGTPLSCTCSIGVANRSWGERRNGEDKRSSLHRFQLYCEWHAEPAELSQCVNFVLAFGELGSLAVASHTPMFSVLTMHSLLFLT